MVAGDAEILSIPCQDASRDSGSGMQRRTITSEIGKRRFPWRCPDDRAVRTRISVNAENVTVGA